MAEEQMQLQECENKLLHYGKCMDIQLKLLSTLFQLLALYWNLK